MAMLGTALGTADLRQGVSQVLSGEPSRTILSNTAYVTMI